VIDFLVYRFLHVNVGQSLSAAKTIGFVAGAGFSYWANGRFTFTHNAPHQTALWRFVLLYAVTLGLNVVVNNAAIGLLAPMAIAFALAFLFATVASTIANYLGMKFFVFKRA
jgi:putative flippase GtrA